MKSSSVFQFLIVLTAASLSSTAAHAHSDVLLTDVGGQVTIGAAEDIGGHEEFFDLTTRTFESILIPGFSPVTPADYESEEPGFFALNGVSDATTLASLGTSALPGSASVSVTSTTFSVGGLSADLFYWDGAGPVDFNPAPAGVSFAFDPSVDFATTGPNGDMDDHPIYGLEAASGVPADGVYLTSSVVDVAGLTTSDKYFSVLLVDALIAGEDDAEAVEEALELLEEGLASDAVVDFGGGVTKDFAFFEEAVEFVEGNLAVPEPSTAMLGFVALSLIAMQRSCRLRSTS